MKILFTGSDIILLNKYPKQVPFRKYPYIFLYRLFIKISRFCTEEYWVVHEHLLPELKQFGITAKVFLHPYTETVYKKRKHSHFTVLFYCPDGKDKAWNEWLYGADIWEKVKYHYKGQKIRFWEVDGSEDITKIYPEVDFYLRCNRHDGGGRMIDECKVNNIAYYWSWENPDFEDIIKAIDKCRTSMR